MSTRSVRRVSRALICCAGLWMASMPGPAVGADPADTSRLPRTPGATQLYESAATTIFVSPVGVPETAKGLLALLAADGWQIYTDPFAMRAIEPNAETMTLKKGAHGLTVRVAPAPAQGNATTVNYVAMPLRHDLPIPADGTDIKYDPNRPHLEVVTGLSFADLQNLYRIQLTERGWSLFMPPDGTPAVAGDATTERAFFVRDQQRPLLLFLRRRDDGRTAVKLESVPQQLLPGTKKPEPPPPPAAAATPPREPAGIPGMPQIDALIGQVLKDALAPPSGRAAPPPPVAAATEPPLAVRAGDPAAIPLPETAEDVAVDRDAGSLEFSSPSSVRALADFFRTEMKRQKWAEQTSVINRSNMVVLNFGRDRKTVSITVMQMGPATKVTATGSGLVDRAASKPETAKASVPAASDPALAVADSGGLPVPKPHGSVGSTRSLFLAEATATVPASVPGVLAFYRRELATRGWTENPGAKVSADRAEATFATADGPARLLLVRNGSETEVSLLLRKEVEARKSGLMPKAGQVRLLLGSVLDTDSSVVIGGRTIKVAAGVGQKAPDGPTLEVKPGMHKITVRSPGKPDYTETIKVGAGEIWGLLLGPGGALPLQAY